MTAVGAEPESPGSDARAPLATVLPTAEQELLLRAAHWRGDRAIDAWERWRARANMDKLDGASYRLLPLLYANLKREGLDDASLGRFKGIYRRTWSRNQLLFARATPLLRALHAAGMRTALLKGWALVARNYGDPGLRMMSDADVLVPADRALDAFAVLRAHGWQTSPRRTMLMRRAAPPESFVPFHHTFDFRDGEWHVDLHWHALAACCRAGDDDAFWDASIPVRVGGIETAVLGAADQLLYVFAHGMRWNPLPPVRWAADAMAVLAGPDPVDWERLVREARARQLLLPVRDALAYLQERLDAPVPAHALDALAAAPPTRVERARYAVTLRPRSEPPYPRAVLMWLDYERSAPRTGWRRYAGFVRYLQFVWALPSAWLVPLMAVRRASGPLVRAVWAPARRSPRLRALAAGFRERRAARAARGDGPRASLPLDVREG